MVKMNSLIDKTTMSEGFLCTTYIPELWEKSRNKIGRRTQIREEISSMDSEEVISQSHVSFCRLVGLGPSRALREGSGGQVARSLPRQVARLVITSSY